MQVMLTTRQHLITSLFWGLCWLVGWLFFGLYGPLRQCFSQYRAVSQTEGEGPVSVYLYYFGMADG